MRVSAKRGFGGAAPEKPTLPFYDSGRDAIVGNAEQKRANDKQKYMQATISMIVRVLSGQTRDTSSIQ